MNLIVKGSITKPTFTWVEMRHFRQRTSLNLIKADKSCIPLPTLEQCHVYEVISHPQVISHPPVSFLLAANEYSVDFGKLSVMSSKLACAMWFVCGKEFSVKWKLSPNDYHSTSGQLCGAGPICHLQIAPGKASVQFILCTVFSSHLT